MDGDPFAFIQTLAAQVETLFRKVTETDDEASADILELQKLASSMGEEKIFESLQRHAGSILASKQAAIVVPTGGEPLKMWEASFWVKQFPELFPYGDGAYGLSRRKYLSLQQWAVLMMTRTELDYTPATEVPPTCSESKPCKVCLDEAPSVKRVQPRWSSHTSFRFVVYDCWRRSEIMKKAKMHVRKKGFQQNLKLIATTSAEHIRQAMSVVGSASSMHQVAVDDRVDPGLRRALKAGGIQIIAYREWMG